MFGSGSSKELPDLASFAVVKSGLFVLRICILWDFIFFIFLGVVGEGMQLTCRLCLGSFSASRCSVIVENWRGFTLLLLRVSFLMGTWINLVHLELGRFGQAPKGSGSSWKRFQSPRPSRGTETSCLLVFPPVASQLLLDLQPSAEASTGAPSCARVSARHRDGSGRPCPGEAPLQKSLGERPGRHHHLLGCSHGGCQRFPWVCRGGICSGATYLKLSEH